MAIFKAFVTIMGVAMSLGYFPQAYKIWKNKSSATTSIPSFIIFSIGTLTWFIYGLITKDILLIIGFIFGVVGSFAVLFLSIFYRNK